MLSVLIVDDHLLIRYGLMQILSDEFRIDSFGEAQTATQASSELARRSWDLVVLDISLPHSEGFQVLRKICGKYPKTKVLAVSERFEHEYATRAMRLGALGYISKDADRVDLVRAFRAVLKGKKYTALLPPKPARLRRHSGATILEQLSVREYAVMQALSSGERPIEISARLNLSIKTISTYRRRILNKLGLKSNADLVRYVIDKGLS